MKLSPITLSYIIQDLPTFAKAILEILEVDKSWIIPINSICNSFIRLLDKDTATLILLYLLYLLRFILEILQADKYWVILVVNSFVRLLEKDTVIIILLYLSTSILEILEAHKCWINLEELYLS